MSGANPQLSIGQMAAEIWARRRFLLIVTITVGILAATVTLLLTPMYRATVLLAPPEKSSEQGGLAALAGQFSGLADLAGVNLSSGANVDQSIALMTSRQFTNQFILDEHVRQAMYPKLWDPVTNTWRQGERSVSVVSWIEDKLHVAPPDAIVTTDGGPSLWKTAKRFNQLRTITQDRKTSLVMLTIDWRDPITAAKWANDMVSRLNQHARDRAVAEANRSLEYLNGELSKTNVLEMQQTIYRLIEREMRTNVSAHVRDEYAFRVLDPAVPPEERASPKRVLTTLAAMFAAAFAASLWIIFGPAPRRKARLSSDALS
jgi:uncharacterized protein involved in exopolysaccharide biosynthesis